MKFVGIEGRVKITREWWKQSAWQKAPSEHPVLGDTPLTRTKGL